MKTKVVVFGGSGFLGGHLSNLLADQNYEVSVFDKENYDKNKKINYIKGDILDIQEVNKSIKNANYVFHFAGISDIEQSNENAFNTINQNIVGTTNILESCIKNKVKRFIFASSIYIYTDKGGFYKVTKQACESIIRQYFENYKLNFTIIRFGSIYGPKSNNLNFVHNIIKNALTKGTMVRKGEGNEIRQYIHVADAANATIQLLDHKYSNQHIMITGSQRLSIREILNMINEILGKKIKIKYSGRRLASHYEITPYSFKPIIAKKLNLNSEIDLGEGILDLIYNIYDDLKKNNKKISRNVKLKN